jgi:hypothetical protein
LELFKLLYFDDSDFNKHPDLIESKVIGLGFTEQKSNYVKSKFVLSRECRHCKDEVLEKDFAICASYWNNGTFGSSIYVCHKGCVKEQKENEAYECQKIDRDCNDCKFFKRGEVVEPLTQKHKDIIVSVDLKNPPIYTIGKEIKFHGKCEKHNIGTYAFSQFASGYECFVHRKD